MIAGSGIAERDGLLQQARRLRAQGRVPEALGILRQLQASHPRFSRLYQERGVCLAQLRQTGPALEALHEAVRINQALPASWDLLARLYRMQGRARDADAAQHRHDLLARLPREAVMASSLLADGDATASEAIARAYLENDPHNVGVLRLVARIVFDRGDYQQAQALLEKVLSLTPDFDEARLDLALACLQRHQPAEALEHARVLLQHDPHNRDYRKQFAAASIALGDHDAVIDIYAGLLNAPSLSGAEVADLRLWRANALKIVGRTQEAIADLRASLAARRSNGAAWFALANLKTYRFGDEDVAAMRALLAQNELPAMDRVYLEFALGKAFEDRADYPASWHHYAAANRLRRTSARYRADVAQACAERLAATFNREFFAAREGWGHRDPAPVFVVGLPRSGSTLIEQILASHSDVEGTQELTEIGDLANEVCGRDPDCGLPLAPEALLRLTAREAEALGARYLAATRRYRSLGRPFFIDKMPNNIWHVGLIHLILPNATIIDVRRAPMACCFSNFKQLFGADHQEFSYALEDLADHYRIYRRLTEHWDTALPGRVHRVCYEDLVTDLEASVRPMLAHCGLAFEPACLSFHQTQRSVRTPSSEQVRQPIGTAGLEQWRHYEAWLEPLRARLGDAATAFSGT